MNKHQPGERLTRREGEVLERLAAGDTNKEVARQLHISVETVKEHVVHILQKTGSANRTQAVARHVAVAHGQRDPVGALAVPLTGSQLEQLGRLSRDTGRTPAAIASVFLGRMLARAAEVPVCVACGCHDGCDWSEESIDLCTACEPASAREAAEGPEAGEAHDAQC
jgi:DNA-binding CsgD family transcriptional regulator